MVCCSGRLCLVMLFGVVSNICVLCWCIFLVSVSRFFCFGLWGVNISSG